MQAPLISIITPTKNNEKTIEQTLLSVATQIYTPIEDILIDSVSSDNTVSIIHDYQEKFDHIRLLSERDEGPYHAMNKGIDLSCGKWIYFLGGDDQLFNPATLTELFQCGVFSGEQVFYGNVLIKGNPHWAKDQAIYDGPFDLKKLLTKNICHQSVFYPREVVQKVGYFNPVYKISADWDFNLRCYAEKEFLYIDQTIAVFKAGGLSTEEVYDPIEKDFIQNAIQYFMLDPSSPSLKDPGNPFYDLITRFHNNSSNEQTKGESSGRENEFNL